MLVFYFLFFLLGLAVGSFLNVVISRLKTRESILKIRSHCPFCQKKLNWYELIPILSFVIQRGKCRKCGKRISWQYPLIELVTGLAFLLILNFQFPISNFQILISTCCLLLVSCFLIILFVYDLKHYLVPDKIIYPAIVLMFGFRILNQFLNYLIASIIAGGFFLAIILISRGKWMGAGDIKIGILMGLVLGTEKTLAALFLAFLVGAFISFVLLILRKKTLKSEIPFAPFLTGATFITLLWGDILIKWYLDLIK